ncbi:MAG: hypothetical protein ACO1G6_02660, partial [Bacteroidota bacterium]
MKFNLIIIVVFFLALVQKTSAHNLIRGNVSEEGEKKIPVAGAVIYFPGQNAGTQSDSLGNFVIDVHANLPFKMIVSMV